MDKLPKALREKLSLRKAAKAEVSTSATTSGASTPITVPWGGPPDFTESDAPCRLCDDPCEVHPQYPSSIKLKIDRALTLAGSVNPYRKHVIIATGLVDWDKEVTETQGSLAHSILKEIEASGLGGKKSDRRTVITNSSLPPAKLGAEATFALVLPDWKMVQDITPNQGKYLVHQCILEDDLEESDKLSTKEVPWDAIVLICSHMRRDRRCGTTAPILRKEFEQHLRQNNLYRSPDDHTPGGVVLACISHIGGHKFAGNVIIYRRIKHPEIENEEDQKEVQGIWLGRVEPCHVEQIVKHTVVEGKVWPQLLRGGIWKKQGAKDW